jgi:type II secretory pathway pseudopilin PulG
MRWKLLLRRLSVSSPRMSVRSHLPWPLRWAVAALVFGFSAAIALWAFEFGKDIAGLDRNSKEELATLRKDLEQLRGEHARARQVADTSESLLKTERAAQERLALQLRQLEAEKLSLQEDLGFYERLLPSSGDGLQLRGLQAEAKAPGQLRYQMLVVQNGRGAPPFSGRYEVLLTGQLEGKAWSMPLPGGPRNLQLRQVGRVEGMIDHPPTAVIKTVQARVMDAKGATRATQTLKL